MLDTKTRIENIVEIIEQGIETTMSSPYFDDLEVVDFCRDTVHFNNPRYRVKVDHDENRVKLQHKDGSQLKEPWQFVENFDFPLRAFTPNRFSRSIDQELFKDHQAHHSLASMKERADKIRAFRTEEEGIEDPREHPIYREKYASKEDPRRQGEFGPHNPEGGMK